MHSSQETFLKAFMTIKNFFGGILILWFLLIVKYSRPMEVYLCKQYRKGNRRLFEKKKNLVEFYLLKTKI